MCGRARQSVGAVASARVLLVIPASTLVENIDSFSSNSNNNLHPGHNATVVYGGASSSSPCLSRMVWGVLPKGGTTSFPLEEGPTKHFVARCYNAVSEELASLNQRLLNMGNTCLLPLDGFYEWTARDELKGSPKQPYFIYQPSPPPSCTIKKEEDIDPSFDPSDSPPPMMVACLYNDVSTGGANPVTLRTFSIMTTATTKSSGMSWLHHRMPLICTTREACLSWLSISANPASALDVLSRIRKSANEFAIPFETQPVTKRINKTGVKVEQPWKRVKLDKPKSVASFFNSPVKSCPSPFPTTSLKRKSMGGGSATKVETKKGKKSASASSLQTVKKTNIASFFKPATKTERK